MNNPHLKARVLVKLPTTPFRDNFRVADNTARMCQAASTYMEVFVPFHPRKHTVSLYKG